MKIFFLRHGKAVDDREFFNDDHLRPLSQDGRAEILSCASQIAKNIGDIKYVFSSPYLRARQSMEIIRAFLPQDLEYAELDLLEPNNKEFKKLLGYFKSLESPSIFYAGHEPQIKGFISYLISEDDNSHIDIGMGSLHFVEFSDSEYVSPGSGSLKFSIPQDILKAS